MLSLTDPTAPPPPPARFNMAAHVLARAGHRPDKIALQILHAGGAESWSYARLEAAVRGIAAGFGALDLAPGALILMRLGNTVDFPLCYLGAIAAGLVPVPTSALLTRPEITRLGDLLAPALVIAGPGIPLPDIAVPDGAVPDGAYRIITADVMRGWESLAPAPYVMGPPARLAYVVTTSGTSGQPRAVAHAHRAVLARAMMVEGWYGLGPDDRVLHAGAFNWTYTLGTGLLDPWTAGATALIPAPGTAPADLPRLLADHGASIVAAAPGVFRQMLKAVPLPALPDLRHALSAGEHLGPALRAAWVAASGRPIFAALGMSECSTFISECPARPAPPGATGYAQTGRRIAVLGQDGTPCPRGTAGELAIHRSDPGLFLGYIGADQATKDRFCGDWFLTGDLVGMAGDGAITYLGRMDDLMNAGGFRVAPQEIETALMAHPGAGEVAVTELQVGPETTVIAAFTTGTASATELARHASECLARYKQPRLYRHLSTLPRTGAGKLDRRALRREWDNAT